MKRHLCAQDLRAFGQSTDAAIRDKRLLLQLDVPIEPVVPRLVQVVWREGAAPVLKLPARWTDGRHVELHMRLLGCAPAFFEVAWQTGGGDIFPAGNPAQSARDDVVEGQIVTRSAILAFKLVAQKQVETGESGIFRRLHILTKCDHRRDFHIEAGAVHVPVVARHNIDLIEEYCLDCGLPRPQAQRIVTERGIISIQHQRRAIFRMPCPASCFESSGMQHKSDLLPCCHSRFNPMGVTAF